VVRPLTVEQVQALIDPTPQRLRVVVLLGAGGGLRIGEVLGLRITEIDLCAGVLRVSAQLQALPGQPLSLRPPKSHSSIRTVPLPETVATAVAEHLRRVTDRGVVVWSSRAVPRRQARVADLRAHCKLLTVGRSLERVMHITANRPRSRRRRTP
jgi:integrase